MIFIYVFIWSSLLIVCSSILQHVIIWVSILAHYWVHARIILTIIVKASETLKIALQCELW